MRVNRPGEIISGNHPEMAHLQAAREEVKHELDQPVLPKSPEIRRAADPMCP
jgi:hypothetical protein